MKPFLRIPAIRVEQNLGVFYAVAIEAETLLDVTYSIRAELLQDKAVSYGIFSEISQVFGGQREASNSRLEQIRNYTEEVDSSFPNSIILGANFNPSGVLEKNEEIKWRVEEENGCYFLVIPKRVPLASIIDGQHRVYGFKDSKNKNTKLLCSIYLDLPLPYHADIFTKINMNQKRVDKNLAYSLFSFGETEGDIGGWSPETLSVYLARILQEKNGSPLFNKMKLGVENSINETSISMASIIDGILSLISSNPEKDRSYLHKLKLKERDRKLLPEMNSAPLRDLYLSKEDKTLLRIIENFFLAVEEVLWIDDMASKFQKTLGIHALFDVLKAISKTENLKENHSVEFFKEKLRPVTNVDFSQSYFGVQTKMRTRLKNTIFVTSKMKSINDLRLAAEEKHLFENAISATKEV